MALPINTAPVYTLEVPSTKKKIKYRPFLVKDEKTLLIAQQSEDPIVMVNSLKEVIRSCVQDEIDVDSLATFDIEYIFTQIRSKSVGEDVSIGLKCDQPGCVDNEKAIVYLTIDVSKIKVNIPEGHNPKIQLFDDVGIIMKYPSLEIITELENLENPSMDTLFDIVIRCIDSIFTADQVYKAKDHTQKEMTEFLNSLTTQQFEKIQGFFNTMPKMSQEVKYKCPVCGTEHERVIEGLVSFFS